MRSVTALLGPVGGVLVLHADVAVGADLLDTPIGILRATTEIHGDPPCTGAHVENNTVVDYPFDGTPVELTEDSEVSKPPASNVVTLVGTLEQIDPCAQRFELSFYGPNAMSEPSTDDLPIFVDLSGTYTHEDAPGGPCTGSVDLFDVGAQGLGWPGVDANDLIIDPRGASARIVRTDGTFTEIALGEHPYTWSIGFYGLDDYRLSILLLSSVLSLGDPWVPELMEDADEVHLVFELRLPAGFCCPGDVDDSGAVDTADLLSMLGAWGTCEACPADLDGDGTVGVNDLLVLLGGWGPCG